jgi:hypothetical protein
VSLGQLAVAHRRREADVYKLLAFLGRYGKQPLSATLCLTIREANKLAEAIGTLMQEEREAHERAAERGKRRR